MNSKPTNRPTGKATRRPDVRSSGPATDKSKAFRPGEKDSPDKTYGRYREDAPAAKAAPPQGGHAAATPTVMETLRAVTAEVKALKNAVTQKDTEIKALQKRLTQIEARQKVQEKASRAQQSLMEHSDVEGMNEDLLDQEKPVK